MIEELGIRDLGVIADATLPLGPGFTAVTGETGAGKTMVVTALGLLLGARSDAGAVRAGQREARVDGRWIVDEDGPSPSACATPGETSTVPSSCSGARCRARGDRAPSSAAEPPRSVCSATSPTNSSSCTASPTRSGCGRLGAARRPRQVRRRRAGDGARRVPRGLHTLAVERRGSRRPCRAIATAAHARPRQLRVDLAEIEEVDPQPGEDVELGERAERLGNLEELRLAAAQARERVSAEESDDVGDAVAAVDSARRQLERVVEHDASLAPILESLTNVSFLVADIAAELSSYLAGLDADGARELEIVQERRAVLAALVRKHGTDLDAVLRFAAEGGIRLLDIDEDDERIAALTDAIAADAAAVERAGDPDQRHPHRRGRPARGRRHRGARRPRHARCAARGRRAAARRALGIRTRRRRDPAHARTSGAEPRPLARGASGGELSRVMLAIEVVIAATDPVPTFVFDEVDAGVGGAAAIEIGRRLARLAESSQVIVVTHLAQVAAFATNHLRVAKDSSGAVTASSVEKLSGEARIAEMARLLSGLADSESGLAHARELVELAGTGDHPNRHGRVEARGGH